VSYPGKLGKKIPPDGQQVIWSSVQLSNGGLTAMIMPANGMSGQATIPIGQPGGLFADIYSVNLTSSDATIEAVTLSDGINSITWQVGTSPVNDGSATPFRFAAGQPLFVSASAITSAKNINVQMRGVVTKT
jgi:hypothetical protein